MNTFTSGLYRFACAFVRILSLIFTGILLISAFLATCYAQDMTTQEVLTKWDNPLAGIAGTALFVCVLLLIGKWVCKRPERRLTLLLLVILSWCLFFGALLVLFSKTVPAADAMSVYAIAESLANGDTSVIHPTNSYLSYYPQQVGLVAFYEPLIRLWNLVPTSFPAYHFIKCIYIPLVCAIIWFQYKTVHLLWADVRTDCACLLLAGANLPLLLYSSFVYGEIPSFASFSAGLFLLVKLIRKPSASNRQLLAAASSLLLMVFSVMLRKNSLILILAAIIVMILEALLSRRWLLLLLALLCAAGSFSILPMTQRYYEHRADSTLSSGVPPMSYFAMGMQESSRGNGWYNSFNLNSYQENGMDTERTNSVSKAAIEERLTYFKAHPGYAASFYLHKYLSQWVDGTYASRQATLATFGGRREFFNRIYDGDYSRYFIAYCNIYQNVLYLGSFLFSLLPFLRTGKRRCPDNTGQEASTQVISGNLSVYLGLIGVFGGFLFHMAWEANSRYIFPYGLLLLPYAAYGVGTVFPNLASHRDWNLIKKQKGMES